MGNYIKATNLVAKPNEDPLEKNSILLCPSILSVENTSTTPPVSPFADEALGWVRLGNDTHKVACSYYWNGCTDKTLTYWRQFPSLLIPTDAANKRQYLHYLAEIQQRISFVMAMDGIFMNALDAANTDPAAEEKNRGRIAARHRGKYGKRSRTNVVFYDGHAEEYEWTLDYEDTPPWLKDPLWSTPELHTVSNLIFRLDDQLPASP